MHRKIYLEINADCVEVAVRENGDIIRYRKIDNDSVVGNIYRGKVLRVTGAGAFVDIGREKDGFLPNGVYKSGDFVTCTVLRAETDKKGCLLSDKLSVSGKYAVATDDNKVHFSAKISENKKNLLNKENFCGVLFRTACENADIMEIYDEYEKNRAVLDSVISKGQNLYRVELLYRENAQTVAENLSDGEIIYSFDGIREEIKALTDRRVEKNGVELIFDRTEAMTVIDVNSHGADKFSNEEAFNLRVNLIAAREVARQIRLRDIGGIIAVDFINLKSDENRKKLLNELTAHLERDDVRTNAELSPAFCVALISRKKRG